MKKSTIFAIKANIGMFILYLLLAFVLGIVFSLLFPLQGAIEGLASSTFLIGTVDLVVQFGVMYFTLLVMLRDLKVSKEDRPDYLQQTFYVFLVLTAVFTLFSYRLVFLDLATLLFTALSIPVGYYAIQLGGKK